MRQNGFTEAGIKKMLNEATERIAMIEAVLDDKARVEHAAALAGACGYDIRQGWFRLFHFYEAQRLLALALLSDA